MSKLKHYSAAYINIVLPGFSGVHIDRRFSAPIVPRLEPEDCILQLMPERDIKSNRSVQHAGRINTMPGIRTEEDHIFARHEVPDAAAQTDPRLECQPFEKADSR